MSYSGYAYTVIQNHQNVQYEISITSENMLDLPDAEIVDEITATLRRGILAQMYPYEFKTEDEWVEEIKQDEQLAQKVVDYESEDRP